MNKLLLGALAALACSGSPAATNLVENGRFERLDAQGRAVGWSFCKAWKMSREGLDDSFAPLFDHATVPPYGCVSQRVKLRPGHRYTISANIRTEKLTGPVRACLEWYGANGKYIGGSYSQGVSGTSDWREDSTRTPAIPTNAVFFLAQFFCSHGTSGKAVLDNVCVKEWEGPLIDGVYSSRYRNAAAEGRVTFKAALYLPEKGAERTKGVFTFSDPENPKAKRSLPATIEDGAAAVSCDVADFALGENRVTFTLSGVAGRKAEAVTIPFTRLTPEREHALKVRIDEYGRAIVDGKPFFPLGMYWSNVDEAKVKTYKEGPFNCLMPYNPPNRKMMDLCAANDLKVIYCVVGRDLSDGSTLRRFRDHPALLAWYLNDEKPITQRKELTAARRWTEAYDPNHPGWIAIYQHTEVRDYLPTFDVVGTDPYPLYRNPIGMVTQWTRSTRRGLLGLKPMWQIPQVFDKGAYPSNRATPAICKPPTFDDMRNMAWQCLAGGANGLIFYSFFDLQVMDKTTPFVKRWAEVKRMGEEIRGYTDFFLSIEKPPELAADSADVACRAWRKDGKTLFAVVNTLREKVETKIAVDGIPRAFALAPTEVKIWTE